jgi:hypothetical protein
MTTIRSQYESSPSKQTSYQTVGSPCFESSFASMHTTVELILRLKRTPTYPDELPDLSVDCEEGDLSDEDLATLRNDLLAEVRRVLPEPRD